MTTVSEAAKEGSAPETAGKPGITADAGAHARAIVTLPAPLPSEPATERVRHLRRVLARAAEIADRPGSLAHARPQSLARARERHHEIAGRHSIPLFRVLRLAWGYAHLVLIKPALNGAEWVTETPLRFFAAVIVALIVWHWS